MQRLKPPSNLLAVLHDIAMAALSFLLALYLRLGDRVDYHPSLYLADALGFTLVLLAVLLHYRIYRRVWRYTSLNDMLVLIRAGTLALLLFYPLLFLLSRMEAVPRSVPFIHWLTLMFCLMGARVLTRIASDRVLLARILGRKPPQVPVLLIGATPQAELFISESERSFAFPYRAEGLVDDDARKKYRAIHHVRIYGSIAETGAVLNKLKKKGRAVQRLLITEPNLSRAAYESLLELAREHQVAIARLPSLSELKAGSAVRDIQPVAVEDILGRPQAVLAPGGMQPFVAGKRVLVTGAGGSIGAELARQIAAAGPAELLLYEQSEYLLYLIDASLGESGSGVKRRAVLGDVRDAAQLARVFAEFGPELVFHAAAIKHVPLGEENAAATVLTNVLGTKLVAQACEAHGVAAMVQVSTDKAVNPASVMGASKRVAEIYCQALAEGGAKTRFITVRFGNVLGSAGSVVPLFQKQIARGGPVTVTDRGMTRYFMTTHEAVQLVLQAAALGAAESDQSEDHARIYVLDMGAPVNITALAEQMIRLAGFEPYKDIPIAFTGIRKGEKLHEELFHADETSAETPHRSIRLARPRALERAEAVAGIESLIHAAREGDEKSIPRLLAVLLPGYHQS